MTSAAALDRLSGAPAAVRWIIRSLEAAGYETWAVGGAVRDALRGAQTGVSANDWDLATRARPEQVRRVFRRTIPIGVDHGTVGVVSRDGTLYEVTTFRRDVKPLGRRALVEFAETLDEDLGRRDFTINAVAWHPERGLHDPFSGADDIERGLLRTVGRAQQRFREDHLRVLRALRFAGHFGLEVEPETWAAIRDDVEMLPGLSAERIREELTKVLAAERPSATLTLYGLAGVFPLTYPELLPLWEVEGGAAWASAVLVADQLPSTKPLLRLISLLARAAEAAPTESGERRLASAWVAPLLLRLRFSNEQCRRVAEAVDALAGLPAGTPDGPTRRRWLSAAGDPGWRDALRVLLARSRLGASRQGDAAEPTLRQVRALRAEWARRPPLTVADLQVSGRDLIALGERPGPDFGRVLLELLHDVLEEPSRNQRPWLMERLKTILPLSGGDEMRSQE